jgi:hypothetical protein
MAFRYSNRRSIWQLETSTTSLGIEFTQAKQYSIINWFHGCGTLDTEDKRVEGINYSLGSSPSGKACDVKIATEQQVPDPQLSTSLGDSRLWFESS